MNIFISHYNSYLKTFFKGGRNSVLGLHPPLSHDHVVGSLVLRLVFDVTCLFIKLCDVTQSLVPRHRFALGLLLSRPGVEGGPENKP